MQASSFSRDEKRAKVVGKPDDEGHKSGGQSYDHGNIVAVRDRRAKVAGPSARRNMREASMETPSICSLVRS